MIGLPVQLVEVAALPRPADPRWADHLTATELTYCRGLRYAADHLAARVAGKRAVLAVLGVQGEPRWHEVEITRGAGGRPLVVLHGELSREARETPGVSLTHAGGHAAAIAWPGADRG